MSSVTQTTLEGWELQALYLEDIGPFDSASIDFAPAGVTLITGQSGTGKTLLLDAIRWMFGEPFIVADDIRPIHRNERDGWIQLQLLRAPLRGYRATTERQPLQRLGPASLKPFDNQPATRAGYLPGLLDYWMPSRVVGHYRVQSLQQQRNETAYQHYSRSLSGEHHAHQLAEIFWRFDYLADSKDPAERALGVAMLDAARRIAAASLIDGGEFSHVKRTTYETMFVQAGQLVPWSSLSSANQHLLGGMLSLLDRMYRLSLLVGTPPAQITETPGILLIDEVETHLHPAWQKRVLPTIKQIFPRVQIIATTHSPFVLASMPGARVYACRQREDRKACVVEHIDEDFSSKPIDEILMSRAFEMTQPYSEVISRLLRERHAAFEANDTEKRRTIEQRLEALNPEEFSIFSLDERIAARRESSQGAQGGE